MAKRRKLVTAAKVLVGTTLGLGIAEAAFWVRDDGAFPHLNVYVADAARGVRLEPGATERIRFSDNAVSSVRINAQGYRGPDWGVPAGDETIVLGDSQTFGLGVEEGETFTAELAKCAGAKVLNAGVPTYGPPEFALELRDLIAKRRPKTVVYVVNFVNDPFEVDRPNSSRHVVWDGWAVRRETAPASVYSFPGRSLLFGQSHAVFALRQWLYYRDGIRTLRLPSEGSADDLIHLAGARESAQSRADSETRLLYDKLTAQTHSTELLAVNADQRIKALVSADKSLSGDRSLYLAAGASPGDIVVPQLGEEGSPLAATALYIRQAAEVRNKLETQFRDKALAHAEDPAYRDALAVFSDRETLEKKLHDLRRAPVEIVRATQPIVKAALAAKAVAEEAGARFVLLALPMDVQVSATEWKKYGTDSEDMTQSLVLVRDLVSAVREAGATAVDPTEALRAAEPGAFLDGDPHLSAKGHAVVGKLLADAIAAPPPPAGGGQLAPLDEGRSRVPAPSEWDKVGELQVMGSDAAGCRTQRIREWMLVRCTSKEGSTSIPQNARVLKGGHGETLITAHGGVVTMVAPITRGDDFAAKLSWSDRSRQVLVEWPADMVEVDRYIKPLDEAPDPAPAEHAAASACLESLGRSWATFIGAPDSRCAATFAKECSAMIACMEGNPLAMPACGADEMNAGSSLHCFRQCSDDEGCPSGRCVKREGTSLCVAP